MGPGRCPRASGSTGPWREGRETRGEKASGLRSLDHGEVGDRAGPSGARCPPPAQPQRAASAGLRSHVPGPSSWLLLAARSDGAHRGAGSPPRGQWDGRPADGCVKLVTKQGRRSFLSFSPVPLQHIHPNFMFNFPSLLNDTCRAPETPKPQVDSPHSPPLFRPLRHQHCHDTWQLLRSRVSGPSRPSEAESELRRKQVASDSTPLTGPPKLPARLW